MRVKERLCERCFYNIIPRRDLNYICLTTGCIKCSQCGLVDMLVVDYRKHGESTDPSDMVMQSGLTWRKVKW